MDADIHRQQKTEGKTLSKHGDLSLADARAEAAIKMREHREGLDPLLAKKRSEQAKTCLYPCKGSTAKTLHLT